MADKQEILDLIEKAGKNGQTYLDLRAKQLTSLPPEIFKLTKLNHLSIHDNQLTSLPAEITNLSNLVSLNISKNKLTSLPLEIANLTKLIDLNLAENQLTSLPLEITKLTKLVKFDVGGNQLTYLLPEIMNLSSLDYLDLGGNQLTSLPAEITKLTNLVILDITGNKLTRLPPGMTNLTKLTRLFSNHIGLTYLPPEITNLTNLSVLHFAGNKLTIVPPEIAKLTGLTNLSFGQNQLTRLPPEITNLTKLTHLALWNNQLTSFPLEITKLSNLVKLDISGNLVTRLPQEMTNLKSLQILILGDGVGSNQLTSLPPEIGKLTNLTEFSVQGNQLTSLPPEITNLTNLTEISVRNNQLTSLPPEITKLTNLVRLDLRGNKLPIPPESLANPAEIKTIFAALAGMLSGEPLNEAKMLVVGDGKVGKSSMVQRLLYDTYDPGKQTTLGVEIKDEMKVTQSKVKGEGEPVKLNIWDFGGQEIQHSTHQFFLTTRSLYLLVLDARKGDQLTNVEYWLKLIESFGGDSPIIIVINQIDQLKGQRPLNLDRKALGEKYNIREFVETSCETGEGFPELKAAIARAVEQLKHVHDIWPREWSSIKKRLKDMSADYIPVETYLEICQEEGLDDKDLQQSLLDILHVLGTIVRFPGETQVLNPRWVTQGVYGLLTSAQLVKDRGQFDLKDVGVILAGLPNADHYPTHTHHRLIEVMRHFELCFEFTDRPGHYLIPRHLHDNELDIAWDDANALKFQYQYETLPDAVISRVIVRMNQYIQQQYYWKNGVFLQSGENRAKIKADLVDRKIFISIIGKEQSRRAFLAVIRSAIDEINGNFKIEIRQMIPIPGSPKVLVSYKDLLVYEEQNIPEIFVPELRRTFSVTELLNGVEELSTRAARRERDKKEGRFISMSEEIKLKAQPGAEIRERSNNPWLSGSFYLFSFVIVIATVMVAIIVLSQYGVSLITGAVLAVVMIGGLLSIGIIGANQLKNDERLSDESYVKLMIESYKRLPLLRGKR